ncbi:MAG: hypothetical protein O7G13_11690 [Alphaproteobacteria bacterium]|nr:hypothetical protein [Alphaproteobacteria bacterium]
MEHRELHFLWGAKAIGEAIKRSERQTRYLIEKNKIPVRRVDGTILGERGEIIDVLMSIPIEAEETEAS